VNPRLLPPAAAARSVLRTQSDTRLIDLTRAGSEPAFEAIVTRYRRALVRHCANVVGDADAEEAAQDALLKAHAALLRGDPVRRLAPWLHVIAHNTALSYLRARSARPQAAEMDCDCDYFAAVDTSADSRDELHEVLAAVRSLPDRQRDAIVMRELEGRSYGEIAARLGSSHGAVRQLLNRGSVRCYRSGRSRAGRSRAQAARRRQEAPRCRARASSAPRRARRRSYPQPSL
jgi:RNA polymerase sigma factor (sigma-70 family)